MPEVVIRNNNVTVQVTQPGTTESVMVLQGAQGSQGVPGVVQSIVAGANITVNSTDPANPVISASGGSAAATTFTPTGNIAATNVQAALAEVDSEKETPAGAQAKVDTHVNKATAAHAATAISVTPTGAIASTTVQAALAELDSEKSATTHVHSAIAARVRPTVAQSIANATATSVTHDTVTFDPYGMFSAAAPTRLTVPAGYAGKWLIQAGGSFATNATGARQLRLLKNGVAQTVFALPTVSGFQWSMGLGDIFSAGAGDYFELVVYQDSGAALNTYQDRTFLAAVYLGT